jgi:pre-60S factor REI1
MTENHLDNSLNTSKKNLICNHCMYDCMTYENMREHYRSDFHKYNLNRVTMNLNPLTFPEYQVKKEMYQKAYETKNKITQNSDASTTVSNNCDICRKSFASYNKLKEHMVSKTHKKMEENIKSNTDENKENKMIVDKQEEKTTKDDITICLFCNTKSDNIENNIIHMINFHKFEVPFIYCIKNYQGFIKLLAKKIFTYIACLSCDTQKFKNYKALQNHMVDKQHTFINQDDLEEFIYKFYDKTKLFGIKEKELRKMKEFKTLKIKLSMDRNLVKKKKDKAAGVEEEGWETVSEEEVDADDTTGNEVKTSKVSKKLEKEAVVEESDDEEYGPVPLPNGELLLEDGTVIGNKIYQIYYKQRIHLNKFKAIADSVREDRLRNIRNITGKRLKKPILKYYSITGSNKSSFIRINTLFKARKQVNV